MGWRVTALMIAFGSALLLPLVGCETIGEVIPDQSVDVGGPHVIRTPILGSMQLGATSADSSGPQPTALIVRGASSSIPQDGTANSAVQSDGGFVLNFDGAEIRDVAKAILGDQLGVNYAVDPAVKGSITLHTATAIPRDTVIPALADAFKVTGAAIVSQKGAYQIVPLSTAAQRSSFASSGGEMQVGYQIRVVPLSWVAAGEIQHALDPLVPAGTLVTADAKAKFAVLAGTPNDLDRAQRAIALFDVDWLRQKSFGLFPLKYSSAQDVANDLASVVGKQGPLADSVQVTPIEHLNSILVVSNTYARVTQMRTWIDRFDRGRDVLATKIFIYHVQNGSASELANVLNKVFGGANSSTSPNTQESASSKLTNAMDSARPTATSNSSSNAPFGSLFTPASTSAASSTPGAFVPLTATASGDAASPAQNNDSGLKITADEDDNSLIIVTTPKMYERIESALVQLDQTPVQVLIEATVAEVDITDTFQYGVQNSIHNGILSVLSSNAAASSISPVAGGLSLALNRGNIAATLNLLSTLTKTKVISAPKILVVNNKPASIQVGDQVPIATASAVSTQSTGAPIVNAIQMLDTGIILHVTPRVNSNGEILLDLDQEVSSSVPTVSSNIDSPTIQQRRLNTTVQIDDGQTIIIGGLISDSRGRNRTGVPVLKDIPIVGTLFGTTNDNTNRTELMVLLTPRVVRNGREADQATEELRKKLPMLRGVSNSNAN